VTVPPSPGARLMISVPSLFSSKKITHGYSDAKFLSHFPHQALLGRFIPFDFAPGKFPFSALVVSGYSPGDQDFMFMK